MSVTLTKPEWECLKTRFRFLLENDSQPTNRFVMTNDLLNQEKCALYLDYLSIELDSPTRLVTASMLAKRYAMLTVAPVLFAMSYFNKGLKLSIESSRLESPDDGVESRYPNGSLGEYEVSEPEEGKRNEWREEVLRHIFAEHLSLVFRTLAGVSRVPISILWENAFVRIRPLYEDGIEEEADTSVVQRLREDYNYIVRLAPATIFGERRNPLSTFMSPTNRGSKKELTTHIRHTCCFYYEISAEYCYSCPKPCDTPI
ncbi:(2Fe-2S)-binding protein [Paenibacillus sp. GSMTC-2017]|uniref:(2Fe-2S)-binding protein n=1 Tax=Paenibacillus sp. GSMTC-2017 TaxID=2794350 RepID=UPI0018D707CF|nr:(2Fe-2S)-binding protein [Paenibacillus sp. GSMTC-2017]MBH5318400.1 (2Fe-2S)-binding protein [Paenibacillus sp. GSMTC-2017]